MKRITFLIAFILIASQVLADIVKKPTVTVLGGYNFQSVSLSGSGATSKPTITSLHFTLEVPAGDGMQYIFSGEGDFLGGNAEAGSVTAAYSGNAYTVTAGVKFEL